MSPPTVPSELVDYIIDFAHDDRDTLRHCSLVSRIWVPSSRHHLFGAVEVSKEKCETFLGLLDPVKCTIRQSVRFLRIDDPFAADNWVAKLLPELKAFTAVTSLYLYVRTWSDIHMGVETDLSIYLPGITALKMRGVGRDSLDCVVDISRAFSSLKCLTLMYFASKPPTRSHSPPLLLKLCILDLINCSIPILSWITSLESIPPIHTVRIIGIRDLPIVGGLLQKLEKTLENLLLGFLPDDGSHVNGTTT